MGIRKEIKKKLCEALLERDIFTSKKTSDSKIKDLLKLIQPKSIDINHIRIGGKNDGGYLVPEDLDEVKYCFSPGVGNISFFENELSKKNI